MAFISACIITLLLHCGSNALPSSNRFVEVFKIQPEPVSENASYKIMVNLTSSLHEIDSKFLSVTIDSYAVKVRWPEYHFRSAKLHSLAAALSPCDIRLGGTYSDFLIFDPNGTDSYSDEPPQEPIEDGYKFDSGFFDPTKQFDNFTMTGAQWDNLTDFLAEVGWDLMFDFNLFLWNSGEWDPTNAELLLNYSFERGIQIPYFQLGNEPNSYFHNFNFTYPPEKLTESFEILKNVTSKYPLYNTSGLYGPDVTNLNIPHGSIAYLSEFISSGAYDIVSGITLHHYYLNGRTATVEDFLNTSTLETLKSELEIAVNLVKTSPRRLPILLTETSSCFGGGAPGLSDIYLAGFLWLDKLGLASQYGFTRVFRQTFLGASYGLLTDNMNPNPDFYLSVLFKRLVEGPVFNISIKPQDPRMRVYANCARRNIYEAGALVIYFMNLRDIEVVLDLPQFEDVDLDLYLLTPGDNLGLKSREIKLNGNLLRMEHCKLPPLLPKRHFGKVTVDALSFGFIVVPNSNVTLCTTYFKNSTNG